MSHGNASRNRGLGLAASPGVLAPGNQRNGARFTSWQVITARDYFGSSIRLADALRFAVGDRLRVRHVNRLRTDERTAERATRVDPLRSIERLAIAARSMITSHRTNHRPSVMGNWGISVQFVVGQSGFEMLLQVVDQRQQARET